MKRLALSTTTAAIALLSAAFAPAIAEDRSGTKAPPKTMGDEGKLPATDTVTGKVPDMGATTAEPNTATPPRPDATAPKKMGDEGKLPATDTMSGQVPVQKP